MDAQISFAPLAAMPQLRRLDILWSEGGSLSDAQADELRALPRLHQLYLSKMKTETLHRLLRQPHQLQWQRISLPEFLGDEAAALLPQLSSLTQIAGGWVQCTLFDWLRDLPNLTDVDLTISTGGPAGRAESLAIELQSCTNIQTLSLDVRAGMTSAHLTELLPRLPRLESLQLAGFPVDLLAFLSQPPLTTQLNRLSLEDCARLSPAELRHVHALCGLQELRLCQSFTAPLDEHCQSLLTPPSALLPRLEFFEYVAL